MAGRQGGSTTASKQDLEKFVEELKQFEVGLIHLIRHAYLVIHPTVTVGCYCCVKKMLVGVIGQVTLL